MENSNNNTWCLIESNPCIFYDMLQKMGAKGLSVEDIFTLSSFDEYRENRDEVRMSHILGMEEYKGNSSKRSMKEEAMQENKNGNIVDNRLYKETNMDRKYNKLLKNYANLYGIIFLFNLDENYKTDKFVEHTVPPNLFFAKQMIPNACATQAILSIILNKEINLKEEIKNIKTFTEHFDYTMKGITLTNCDSLREIHNSYKPMVYIDNDLAGMHSSSDDNNFHFVSYIHFDQCVYLLDGLQNGPVLIKSSKEEIKDDWIGIAIDNIQNEMNEISNNNTSGKDCGFNLLAIIKDRETLIRQYMSIHMTVRMRATTKLISLGENIQLMNDIIEKNIEEEKVVEEEYMHPDIPEVSQLPENVQELHNIILKATKEIHFLEDLLDKELKQKRNWKRELDFKFFNFCPFIISSIKFMSKYNMLNDNYQQEKERKKNME